MSMRMLPLAALIGVIALCLSSGAAAEDQDANTGPYNVRILEGGVGMSRPLSEHWPGLAALSPWSLSGRLRLARQQPGWVTVAAVGDALVGPWRGVALHDGKLVLVFNSATAQAGMVMDERLLDADRWYAVAASFDGREARLYIDGEEVKSRQATTSLVAARIALAPPAAATEQGPGAHFGGELADFGVASRSLSAAEIASNAAQQPNYALINFHTVGAGWPLQEKAWRGLQVPQDPWTLPKSRSAQRAPIAQTEMPDAPAATPSATLRLTQWRLKAEPGLQASGAQLSKPQYDDSEWFKAIVPGTVLTTLVARGVYADPDYGLNNLAIPESLARQDYWYRCVFKTPPRYRGDRFTLTLKGINYAAEVWLNGKRLGNIKGAFVRGVFEVGGQLNPDLNALALRVSPPPHPGIPHEQSILAGPGENGGALALDGPTFIASEGWDWIPGIRDRETGIWQDVEITQTQSLRLGDPHIVTHLALPNTDKAELSIDVPVENLSGQALDAEVTALFDGRTVSKTLRLPPGVNNVHFDPREYAQLRILQPRLWWPNGYGEPNLYKLQLDVASGGTKSDSLQTRFGIRELTYELSLFDHMGRLRRVEIDPASAGGAAAPLVDVRHEAIKRTPTGWAESLTAAGETSQAVHPVLTESLTPYLVIRVNGVPIAARGGSWGMDDSRKRISRDRMEPYFKLQRSAHLNIVRNWLGQNTEDIFYDLADEYGLLVLNDFWISTQDFQLEPEDAQLFLTNARDVISRYRNHPSIAVWFGRNEGVPPPLLNEGLDHLVATLDGTRYYTGSSNSVNLQGSGPYNYRSPEGYFTDLAQGFSVEVGTPSLSTLESLRKSIPPEDLWPLSDTYAYHDWHFGGNGDVASFMTALERQYGAANGLEEFERKAQMMNYVTFRAIFEGFQAHLWTRNSGRLLWMSHPSWPSNTWQLYSSDYDAGAAYYAVKKACESLHAQLTLPDQHLQVVNTTRESRPALVLNTRVFNLNNQLLMERTDPVDATANATTAVAALDLQAQLKREGLVLVSLRLTGRSGELLSDNLYWQGQSDTDLRRLNGLSKQAIDLSASIQKSSEESVVSVALRNPGPIAAVAAKITVLDQRGERVLPSYYSDNYITLLPGESKNVEVHCPRAGEECAQIAVRGWNVVSQKKPIAPTSIR